MGMMLNGGTSGGMAGVAMGTATVKKNSVAETIKKNQSSTKKKTKKKLNYNPREISSQLMRANKSTSAGLVLARSRSKLSALQRAKATGQYNDSEMRSAIIHARRMIDCSRMKMNNLRQEEQEKSKNSTESNAKKRQKKAEVKRRVHQKEQHLKAKVAVEENQRILTEKRKQQELRLKKKLNRTRENGKILEADMKYLKDQMNHQGNQSADYGSVVVDISAMAAQMAELQRLEQQIQREAEFEVSMESGGTDGGGGMEAAGEIGTMAPAADVGGAELVSVDVTV